MKLTRFGIAFGAHTDCRLGTEWLLEGDRDRGRCPPGRPRRSSPRVPRRSPKRSRATCSPPRASTTPMRRSRGRSVPTRCRWSTSSSRPACSRSRRSTRTRRTELNEWSYTSGAVGPSRPIDYDDDTEALQQNLFVTTDVPTSAIVAAIDGAVAASEIPDGKVQTVSIKRNIPFDANVIIFITRPG